MQNIKDLIAFWQQHAGEPLALCTLVHKEGSSYRGVGAKKIVRRDDGGSCGLLSGGCLEQDIEATVRERWDGLPFIKSFSTMSDSDRLLGYQTGCTGVIDILFEPLPPAYDALYLPYGASRPAAGVAIAVSNGQVKRRLADHPDEAGFFDSWVVPIELSLIGAGPDAPVFAELVKPLGWELQFFDHRPDYVAANVPVRIMPLAVIADTVPTGATSAVILMTHNYEADLALMARLAGRTYGYVGCLGPRQRFEQMKLDLKQFHDVDLSPAWEAIVRAPAGLLPKGRSPAEIALSIVVDIQARFQAR